jgi:hypothetical protein
MKKSTRSPQGQFEPEYLPAFFKAIDIDQPFLQSAIGTELQQIASAFWRQFKQPSMGAQNHKKLRQYLRASYKKRALRQALGPAVQHQIIVAGFLQAYPDADAADLSASIAEEQISFSRLEKDETEHEQDIKFLIALGHDYRKRLVTKLVVEPVLQLLQENGVKPSRKLPLNRMAGALFDLLGIAARDRVSDAAITSAWRRLNRRQAKV